ncbi:MAG: hypothetical protein IKG30_04980 [Clostridiales bacterium]|nr:hypothetical protein [Clostridiales bacterium]
MIGAKRKVLTAVLAATLLMTACSSKTGNDETENTDTKSTSAEETTVTTETEPEGDVIIPLYKPEFEDEIREVNPVDLFYFEHFEHYFPISSVKEDENGRKMYQLEYGNTFDLTYDAFDLEFGYSLEGIDPMTTTSVEIYFMQNISFQIVASADGNSDNMSNFVPLFYNQTKGCLAGYSVTAGANSTESVVRLVEVQHGYTQPLTYSNDTNGTTIDVEDPGEYGFTTIPTADTPTLDVIVPLYKPELENEIKSVSPADLYEFDNYSKYFPVETVSDDGFTIYQLVKNGDIKLRDVYNDINTDNKTLCGVEYYAYGRSGDVLGGFYYDEDKSILDFNDLAGYYDYSKGRAFVPLLYDQTRGCLVGYVPEESLQAFKEENIPTYNGSQYYLIEMYYGSTMPFVSVFPASNYGKYGF